MGGLDAGWKALARGDWSAALEVFEAHEVTPEALEGIGMARWWLDDADGTIGARERAYRLYRARGDNPGAARVASALAWDSIVFGGRPVVARGWLDRATRLLENEPLGPEHAWLAVREAEAAAHQGELDRALEAARRGISLGQELGLEDVQVVGRSLEGVALVRAGAIEEGIRRLDESAAAATAGEVDDLMWIGKVCCNLIAACEDAGDFDRAVQWCDEVKAFARRWELRTLFNVCRTQYASILVHRGTWSEAEAELEAALQDFGDSRRLAPGIAQLGELRRRQGRLDEARTLFARVEHHPVARMGVAELALDAGDAAGAISLAERVLRGISREERLRYVPALGIVVRAAAVAGRIERAREAAAQLRMLAAEIGAPQFRAAAALAEGIVAAADGDDAAACALLEDAVELYGRSQMPYERARARLLLARALGREGLTGRALEEASAAEEAFVELDAARDARTAFEVLRSLDGSAARAAGLTRREVDVLPLVARGLSNRDIAEALVLSEHTIHRHVANILRKLGEPSRAAAAARATRDGVI